MPKKRVVPTADEVMIVYVWNSPYGFRYTARGWDNKVLYDSPSAFKSRRKARDEIWRYWPGAQVSFEVI